MLLIVIQSEYQKAPLSKILHFIQSTELLEDYLRRGMHDRS